MTSSCAISRFGRGQPVALDDEVADFIPVLTTEVGVVPDPTARPMYAGMK